MATDADLFYRGLLAAAPRTWTPQPSPFADEVLEAIGAIPGYRPKPDRWTLAERARIAADNLEALLEEGLAPLRQAFGGYPAKVDWRDRGGDFVTGAKNQGLYNACAAFGNIAAVESAARIARKAPAGSVAAASLPILSEGQLFFQAPGMTGDDRPVYSGPDAGWNVDDALACLKLSGVVPASLYPYDQNFSASSLPAGWPSLTTAIAGSHELRAHRDMKRWLAERGPLVSVMTFRKDFLFYARGTYEPVCGAEMGGHCVCVVGYDDDNAAWICKNSWGAEWGERGFFRIEYGQCGIDAAMWGIDGLSRVYQVSAG